MITVTGFIMAYIFAILFLIVMNIFSFSEKKNDLEDEVWPIIGTAILFLIVFVLGSLTKIITA